MELVERDYKILREIERWRFCLSRHIQFLAGFSSQRVCDRRLRLLIDNGLLNRQIVLYGVPNVYLLTSKAKTLISANQRKEQIRLDQIIHDIAVLDVAVCFMKTLELSPSEIKTDKQLHQEDGFGQRTHHPDFVFTKDNTTYCVEIELSLKSKARLENNIKSNFLKYNVQIWVTDKNAVKLIRTLKDFKIQYPNIEITNIEEVKNELFQFDF